MKVAVIEVVLAVWLSFVVTRVADRWRWTLWKRVVVCFACGYLVGGLVSRI